MKTMPCISASDANSARLALVLPVEAQATRFAPDHPRVGERGGHAVVFEAAAGIQPFVLQQQIARLHAHLPGEQIGLLQARCGLRRW